MDVKTGRLKLHAGSGNENIIDGKLYSAALAQPSGITTDGKKIYIADSEVSAVRSLDIDNNGDVNTLIGQGLFVFGDKDGNRRDARLQHPLGIVFSDGLLYIADTYNNKIKIVDPVKEISRTYAGTGKEGMKDGQLEDASFNEPGGLSYANDKIYIADTNNDLIRVINMKNKIVSTLVLKNLEKLNKNKFVFDKKNYQEIISEDDQNIHAANQLQINLTLPKGYKINDLAPNQMRIFSEDGAYLLEKNITSPEIKTEIDIPDNLSKIYAELVVYYCRKDNEGLCLIKNILYELNHSEQNEPGPIKLKYALAPGD